MKSKMFKIVSMILAMTFIVLSFASCKGKKYDKTGEPDSTTAEASTEAPLPANINPLTGLELSKEAEGKRPVAIMVENSPAARPQWGLSTPDIVLEGVVEGGITRMMWIYADVAKVPKVGPVRSARHDYVEIAYGMNAVFAHWGGSKPAYSLLKSLANKGYIDVDGKYIGTNGNESNKGYYFFKDPTHSNATEHCGYTNGSYLSAAIAKKNIDMTQTKSDWAPFKVITDGERAPFGNNTGTCSEVTVTFSSSYKHTFKYDPQTKLYKNFMNTSEMKDGNTGEQMAVRNVIVMYANVSGYATSDNDMKKLREWDLTEGEALYITNGYGEAKITWKKGDMSSPLKFYGKDGKELTVNRGQTWIGVVPYANKELTQITA